MKWIFIIAALSIVLFITSLIGCKEIPNETSGNVAVDKNQQLRNQLIQMGFQKNMIEDKGTFFLVEGDISFEKSRLEAIGLAKVTQAYRSTVDQSRIRNVTVSVDASIPVGGVNDWRPAVQSAINQWNNIRYTSLTFSYTTTTPSDITVKSDGGVLGGSIYAMGDLPFNGKAGTFLQVNLDAASGASTDFRRCIMIHELGHTIGLRHTNWWQAGEQDDPAGTVYGTPESSSANSNPDPFSIMNQNFSYFYNMGFTFYDSTAVATLYPTQVGYVPKLVEDMS